MVSSTEANVLLLFVGSLMMLFENGYQIKERHLDASGVLIFVQQKISIVECDFVLCLNFLRNYAEAQLIYD